CSDRLGADGHRTRPGAARNRDRCGRCAGVAAGAMAMSKNPLGSQARARYEATRDFPQEYHRSKERWQYQSVRLDHDDAQMLKVIAERRKTTVAELIRTFVAWGLENEYGGADAD